jgi:predicted dinucleotide-binding enzyme
MKIAILGGTGKLGLALALRLSTSGHEAAIGSRVAAKAQEAARSASGVRGLTNLDAAMWCDAALVSVPYSGHRVLFESLKERFTKK